jgi:hypothetical protein
MTILKAAVPSGPEVLTCDAVFHEGKYWLVPEWLEDNESGSRVPARLVCISNLRHQVHLDSEVHQLTVNEPVPREILDGTAEKDKLGKFLVAENPAGWPELEPPTLH